MRDRAVEAAHAGVVEAVVFVADALIVFSL